MTNNAPASAAFPGPPSANLSPAVSAALDLRDLRASRLGALGGSLWARLRSLLGRVSVRRAARRLRLSESLSLGEKRLIAVVEFEEQRFLVAATPEHITLLQTLAARPAGTPPAEGA
jgi:hypothetical protein